MHALRQSPVLPGAPNLAGTITVDADGPWRTRLEAMVQATTIDTENDWRHEHPRNAGSLDVERHPPITFASTQARRDGEKVPLSGNLTLQG